MTITGVEHDAGDAAHCQTCAPCRETHNKRVRARAQGRALRLLARTFAIEFTALYLQELDDDELVEGPRSRQEADRG